MEGLSRGTATPTYEPEPKKSMVPGTFFGSISAVGGGKSQEGGPRRLYAETADHAQRHPEASDALADGTASARLTVKTVADPNFSLLKR